MDELVDAGILYRIQGRGTFVRQNKLREKLTLNSFLDAWTPKAGGFNVRVAALERVPADDSVAENLAIRPGAEVFYIRRLRLQNETIVAIDDRYMRSQDCSRIRRLGHRDVLAGRLPAQPRRHRGRSRRNGNRGARRRSPRGERPAHQ
jgi:DNA-binding GntR family transcriptional regulator